MSDDYEAAVKAAHGLAIERDQLNAEIGELRGFLARKGYRPCDIPTCNCGSWHGGADRANLDKQIEYTVALQRAIEHHCRGAIVPPDLAAECPNHAEMLNARLAAAPVAWRYHRKGRLQWDGWSYTEVEPREDNRLVIEELRGANAS